MQLQTIISKFPNAHNGIIGDTILNVVGSSPIVPLLKPIREFRSTLVDRSGQYDALNCALLSVSGIWDGGVYDNEYGFADTDTSKFDKNPFWGSRWTPLVQITEAEFDTIVSGLYQAIPYGQTGVSVTDGQGNVYQINMALTKAQYEQRDTRYSGDGFCFCRFYYSDEPDDYEDYSLLYYSATDNTFWISPYIWSVNFNFHWEGDDDDIQVIDSGVKTSLMSVVKDLVTAADINAALIQSCDALTSGNRISDFIQLMQLKASEQSKTIRNFFSKFAQAYTQGGLKGVIYYILSFAKSTQSIQVSDNGCLVFTDNSIFRPAEYIAGMVQTVVSTLTTLVAAIVAIFSRVVAIILQVLGTVAWGIIGSFVGDKSNTLASMAIPNDVDDMLNFLPCGPLALASGTLSAPNWYKDLYEQGESVIMYDCVGGSILIGPGAFDTDGNLTHINWEFHPSAVRVPIETYVFSDLFKYFTKFVRSKDDPNYSAKAVDFGSIISHGGRSYVEEMWTSIMSNGDYIKVFANSTETGVLSSNDDKYLFGLQAFYTALFYIWIMVSAQSINDLYRQGYDHIFTVDSYSATSDIDTIFKWFAGIVSSSPYGGPSAAWSGFVTLATSLQSSNSQTIHLYVDDTTWTSVLTFVVGRSESSTMIQTYITNCNFYGAYMPISGNMKYTFNVPKYNGNTFWKWVAAAIGVAVVASAAIAICSYKWYRFKKAKIAQNIVKFNNAQSTYQDAVSGVKETVDPETGEIIRTSFDVTTDEGREYIDQCWKDYKVTALSNNAWSTIIGGSKYDVTSFWGEKDSGEEEQIISDDESVIAGLRSYDDFSAEDDSQSPLNIVYKLISGKELR